MKNKIAWKEKCKSARYSLLAAVVSVVTLVAFLIYGFMYQYMDTVVVLSLVLSIAAAAAYAFVDHVAVEYCNLIQVLTISYGFGLFFLNSHPVWADRLNNIDMYGARGSLVPVVLIMILFLAAAILGIMSCFQGKEAD